MTQNGSFAAETSPEPPLRPRSFKEDPGQQFSKLAQANSAWLRGWFRGQIDDEELVDDLTQEAFLKAFRNFPRLRDPDRFAPWLFRTAQNLLRDHWRRRRREQATLLEPAALDGIAGSDRALENVAIGEESAELLKVIRALPAAYREPLLLRHAEDLSYQDIGRILGIKENAVRVRLCRARRMARQRLKMRP